MHVGCGGNIKQNWAPLLLNLLALIGIGVHGIIYFQYLPATVTYHYDAYGKPDRFISTRSLLALYWITSAVSSVVMIFLSTVFSMSCFARNCTSPEETTYTPEGRKYLRLVVASWALWLNLCVLALIFTIFAVILQNALKEFDKATTLGVYLPFLVFVAGLVLIVYWMISHIQSAKALMYSGFFGNAVQHDPSIQVQEEPSNDANNSQQNN